MILEKNEYFKNNIDNITFDTLTHALSRKSMIEYIKYLIKNNTPFSLFFIDLDDFKAINDSLGHSVGDEALIITSDRMFKIFNENNGVVARYGGDEFFAVVENEVKYENIWHIGKDLNELIRKQNDINDIEKALPAGKITITTGISRFPKDGKNIDELLEVCDKALYRGKLKGKNCFIIYNEELHADLFIKRDNRGLDIKGVIDYVFREFTNKKYSIEYNLKEVISFASKYFDVTLAAKNYDNKFEVLYSKDSNVTSEYVDENLYLDLKSSEVDSMVFMYINKLGPRHADLKKTFEDQKVHSSILIPCQTKTKNYCYLRIDAKHERIWTKDEKIVFQIIANLYAMLLEFAN